MFLATTKNLSPNGAELPRPVRGPPLEQRSLRRDRHVGRAAERLRPVDVVRTGRPRQREELGTPRGAIPPFIVCHRGVCVPVCVFWGGVLFGDFFVQKNTSPLL